VPSKDIIHPLSFFLTFFSFSLPSAHVSLHFSPSCRAMLNHFVWCRWIAMTKATSSTGDVAEAVGESESEVNGIMLVPIPNTQTGHQVA
jgi:hypothetical protein